MSTQTSSRTSTTSFRGSSPAVSWRCTTCSAMTALHECGPSASTSCAHTAHWETWRTGARSERSTGAGDSKAMRFLITDTYYRQFWKGVYERDHTLASQPYQVQLATLLSLTFGTSDFYSSGLRALGHEAVDRK